MSTGTGETRPDGRYSEDRHGDDRHGDDRRVDDRHGDGPRYEGQPAQGGHPDDGRGDPRGPQGPGGGRTTQMPPGGGPGGDGFGPGGPGQGQPPQGQPMQGQPQGQPMQGQPMPPQGQPPQGQPMPPQGQPPQGQPPQGQEPGRYTRQHGDQPGQHDHDDRRQSISVLDPTASERLRGRWTEVQAGFVDAPRQAVTEADQLVGEVLDEVSRVFRDQRSELETEWSGNNEPGTEELRQALQRYREFFDRLLSL